MTDINITDYLESDEWKAYETFENEKRKSIKSGSNVIHLEYMSPLIIEKDINEFEKKVESVGLQLSHFDKNGTMYASLDAFELVIYIGIAQPLIGELIQGIATNAAWDIIKYLSLSTWKKVKNQYYTRSTYNHEEKKEVTFGLKVHLDKNTSINIKLDGNFDEELIQKSLDQVLGFLKEQKLNEKYKNSDFAYFDADKKKWIKVDVDKEIRKMIDEGKLKRK